MKPSLFVLGAAMLLLSATAGQAQNSASTTAVVSATVQVPMTMITEYDMGLPHTMQRGQTYIVTPDQFNANGNGALFQVRGDKGDRVSFTLPSTITLNLGTNDPINHPQLPGVNPVPSQASTITGTNLTAMNGLHVMGIGRTTYTPGTSVQLGGDFIGPAGTLTNVTGIGKQYLWVGASFPIALSQQRGVYLGYFVVQADYAN